MSTILGPAQAFALARRLVDDAAIAHVQCDAECAFPPQAVRDYVPPERAEREKRPDHLDAGVAAGQIFGFSIVRAVIIGAVHV